MFADRNKLVTENMGLVYDAAYKAPGRLDLEDKVQEGTIGLIAAAEKFDPSKGFKFSTYAIWWIRQAIDIACVNQVRAIRLPVHINDILVARAKLQKDHGREFSPEEVAEATNRPLNTVNLAIESSPQAFSLDYTYSEDDSSNLHGTLGQEGGQQNVELQYDTKIIRIFVDQLKEKEATVIRQRFGIDCEPQTLDAIGEKLGVTRERIRQIQNIALAKLRPQIQRWKDGKMFGPEVKKLRKKLGLTQRAFGVLVGVSNATVSWWENGRCKPKAERMKALETLKEEGIEGLKKTEETKSGKQMTLDESLTLNLCDNGYSSAFEKPQTETCKITPEENIHRDLKSEVKWLEDKVRELEEAIRHQRALEKIFKAESQKHMDIRIAENAKLKEENTEQRRIIKESRAIIDAFNNGHDDIEELEEKVERLSKKVSSCECFNCQTDGLEISLKIVGVQ